MPARLSSVPHKVKETPPPSSAGLSHPDLLQLYEAMVGQDPRVVFDSIRPLADEFWNMIDGRRSVADIARRVCLQFDFELGPELFVPFADQMESAGLIGFVPDSDSQPAA